MGSRCERLLREKCVQGKDPAGAHTRTGRGKQAPGGNIQSIQNRKKNCRQLIIQLIAFFYPAWNGEEYEGVIQNFLTPVSLRLVLFFSQSFIKS